MNAISLFNKDEVVHGLCFCYLHVGSKSLPAVNDDLATPELFLYWHHQLNLKSFTRQLTTTSHISMLILRLCGVATMSLRVAWSRFLQQMHNMYTKSYRRGLMCAREPVHTGFHAATRALQSQCTPSSPPFPPQQWPSRLSPVNLLLMKSRGKKCTLSLTDKPALICLSSLQ